MRRHIDSRLAPPALPGRRAALVVLATFALGCSLVSGATSPGIKISPTTAQLRAGQNHTFNTTLSGVVSTNLVWQVLNSTGATPTVDDGSVTQTGVYTAPASIPAVNTVEVKVYDKTQPAVSAIATVTLLNPVPSITSLSSSTINTGLAYTLVIKGAGFLQSSTLTVGTKTAAFTFVSSGDLQIKGTDTDPAGTALQISVTNPDPGGATSNSRTLTVLAPVAVQVSPDKRTIRCGTTLTLSAHVSNNSDQNVTWAVSGGAANGAIDAKGVYTAPLVLPANTAITVTATAEADPTASASVTVNLENAVPVVTSATPSPVAPGPATFTINGSGFATAAQVLFAGQTFKTTWVSDKQLTATGQVAGVPGGIAALKVTNPSPGSASSIPVFINVQPGSTLMSYADAFRFLQLASWGPSADSIAHLQTIGLNAWLAEQFAAPATPYPDPLDMNEGVGRLQTAFFTNALTGPDQLRQRAAFALSEIFVVAANKDTKFEQMVSYIRLLSNSAFGNYRQLMGDMSLNPAMGFFLDMVNNDKANPARNTVANENYARELMQLFTIGLSKLNIDGTATATPNYDQTTVTQMAKVMTGWTYPVQTGFTSHWTNPAYYFGPMVAFEDHHDTTPKDLNLPTACTIAAGGTAAADLNAALDCLFKQDSLPPFVSYRLIQRFVLSNPPAGYVTDVATTFKSSGGDLKQVVQKILTDPAATTPSSGKLDEPVLFATTLLRELGATLNTDASGVPGQTANMGQDVLNAPSVFNYFSPFYRVSGVPAPEFQILNAATALGRLNFVYRAVNNQISGAVKLDLSNWMDLASDPPTLLKAINNALYGGGMTQPQQDAVSAAIQGLTDPGTIARNALYVAATAPQYQVEE